VKTVIGITYSEVNYENYPRWIQGENENIEVVTLIPENASEIQRCQGIVLSGGIDTHPRFYNSEILNYPLAPTEFDEGRDRFELEVFRMTCERKIPVLAICRGMQLVNIALGGDMIQDLESDGKRNHRKNPSSDGIHAVSIVPNSLLFSITKSENGTVNSAHHQGLGRISQDLIVTALSPEGVAEAVEWKDPSGKAFFLGVQWHPERLEGNFPGNPLGNGIREWFLKQVRNANPD
jgi:putative glutamine amidotransferase